MSSKGRQIAKSIGKSIKRKFEADFFQFSFGLEDQQRDLIFLPAPPFNTSPHSSPPLSARKQMQQKMQSVQGPKKSNSLGTIAAHEHRGPGVIDHDEIMALTHDVKKFSDSLARLKLLFTEGIDPEEDVRVIIHEGLGEVLSVLNPVMQQYPALQSPDIFTAARSLITMIKDHDYELEMAPLDIQSFCDAIDQLALAFSSSVSEYLMGDMGPQMVMDFKTKSMNNIAAVEAAQQMDNQDTVPLSVEDLDSTLVNLDTGLTVALQRAKVLSKYVLDIITYIEKKALLELDYAKNLSRLAHTVQNNLKKEGFLPLQSVYCTALSQDFDYANNLQATQAVVQTHKFLEPLTTRRADHDKVYKSVKEIWQREYRRVSDSVTNLRKAQALYHNRQQDHERARDLSLKAEGEKLEKRRKAEEEMLHKAAEAETTYKACVAEANYRQQELFKVKREQLTRIREQIQMCDEVVKSVTVEYFQLYHTIVSPVPLQYQTLSNSSKGYEAGSQYAEYIRRLPSGNRLVQPEVFMFEPYVQGQKSSPEGVRKESVHSNGSVSDLTHSPEGSPVTSPRRDKYRIPVKAWGHQTSHMGTSDTDSASCCSSKSHESSPSGSPHRASHRHLISSRSMDELTEEEILSAAAATVRAQNGQEKGKKMKRTATLPTDDSLDIPGLLMQHRGRRNTTFGVDFQEQVDTFQTKVPPIVSKCLSEIEKRGVMIKGIYRVSGVKSKVEHLCQRFDIDPEAVDLQDIHPNIISNVLKLYLRQLPEPLLTFRLYSEFIRAAKENMAGQLLGDHLINHLSSLVGKLPSSNLRTCAVLMHHLQRVASHSDLNQMSSSNLGIVFGPTLLRPMEGSASLASLVDTPHQTRAIELLISHAHIIFGPSEDFQIAPSQTPILQLDQALDGVLIPGQPLAGDPLSPSFRRTTITSDSGVESENPSLVVSEPSTSSPAFSATQPSACEYTLPGSVSLETQEAQALSVNGLELEWAESRSDDEEEASDLLLLPDQSKPLCDPLSVVLSPQCITVPGTSRSTSATTPTHPPGPGQTVQVTDVIPGADMTKTTPPGRPVTSQSTIDPADHSGSYSVTCAVTPPTPPGIVPSLTEPALQETPGQPLDEKLMLSTEDGNKSKSPDENKAEQQPSSSELSEELAKKLHAQQLENIKYLTKAPSVDVAPDEFYPKVNPSSMSSVAGLIQTKTKTEEPQMGVCLSPLPDSGVVEGDLEAVTKTQSEPSSSGGIVMRPAVPESKGVSSSRRSVLEEMPIPTLSKPRGHASQGGAENAEVDEGPVPAVTLPASPTIKRREIPSRIPTSPVIPRSATQKQGERDDKRADRFKQEQRKLVLAIKSDSKLGAKSTVEETSDLEEKAEAVILKPKRESGVFEDVVSGGCALSVSGQVAAREDVENSQSALITDAGTTGSEAVAILETEKETEKMGKSQDIQIASSSSLLATDSPRQSVGNSQSTPAVTAESSKANGLGSPSKKSTLVRGRPLSMPSTVYTKKQSSLPASNTTSSSPSHSSPRSATRTSTSGEAAQTTKPPSSVSVVSSSSTKRPLVPSSVTTDQNPLQCSRAASSLPRPLEESPTTSYKSAPPTSRKGNGRGGDISSPSKLVTKPQTPSGTRTTGSSQIKGEGAQVERSSSSASQSSSTSSQKRKSSIETQSPTSRRVSKPLQKKSTVVSASSQSTGSPRRSHEKQESAAASSSTVKSGSGLTSPSKTNSPRLSQASISSAVSTSSSSSQSSTQTSTSGKLSHDRSPRFV